MEDVALEVVVSSGRKKTYFQDTADHVVAHSYHDWLIWLRLCVAWTGGPVVVMVI